MKFTKKIEICANTIDAQKLDFVIDLNTPLSAVPTKMQPLAEALVTLGAHLVTVYLAPISEWLLIVPHHDLESSTWQPEKNGWSVVAYIDSETQNEVRFPHETPSSDVRSCAEEFAADWANAIAEKYDN